MTELTKTIWVPGWYNLDQSLEVGKRQTLLFLRNLPEYLRHFDSLVLYNTLWDCGQNVLSAEATVLTIHHSILGAVRRIVAWDTYEINLTSGETLWVDSEEAIGCLYERVDGA
jgi:hypothetical protein